MTPAIIAAPLNSERRERSVAGTRALVSSQQLMGSSNLGRVWHPSRHLRAKMFAPRGASRVPYGEVGRSAVRCSNRQMPPYDWQACLTEARAENYAQICLPVQCIILLRIYAIWR